jgi:Zn-dependent protease
VSPESARPEDRGRPAGRDAPPAGGRGLLVGRLLGIPLRIHWTFLLLLAFVVAVEWGAGWRSTVAGLVWIVALFGFVVEHEIAHCLVARRRGAQVLGILLIPLGGISQLAAVPEDPDDELAIALAGPLASLAAGVALLIAGVLAGARVWPPTLFAGSWWARLAWLNLLLGAFNLLPALPMDGGRVLRAALARHRDRLEATLAAGRIARLLAAALVIAGFLYDFWLVLIGVFVWLGSSAEEQDARRHHPPSGSGPREPDGTASCGQSGGTPDSHPRRRTDGTPEADVPRRRVDGPPQVGP